MELGEVDHQAGHQRLAGALRDLIQAPRQAEGDRRVLLPDLHRCGQTQHVVDGGLHQADCAGDGGADDVLARRSVAAVALGLKSGDPVLLHTEYDSGHTQMEILPISTLV